MNKVELLEEKLAIVLNIVNRHEEVVQIVECFKEDCNSFLITDCGWNYEYRGSNKFSRCSFCNGIFCDKHITSYETYWKTKKSCYACRNGCSKDH